MRSSVSSGHRTRTRNTGASYTSAVPATIKERPSSPHKSIAPSTKVPSSVTTPNRPQALERSVSDYALRSHALNVRSLPERVITSMPVYFCVHCGNGFEKRADWETHEWIFHERQSFWPCPQTGCQSFFDSGRAFEAHHQAVHGCGRCDHASRIVQLLPERKAWACGFKGCKEVFLDWNRRCKHVSSHYESLNKRQGHLHGSPEWTYSTTIRNLLRQAELRDAYKKFMTKCHGHSKSAWPLLEWQPDRCAELQRCLEFRDFTRGVPDIIHLAYRSGHPGYSSPAQQTTSGKLSPPAFGTLSPPVVSPRSSSLRSRTRSHSIRSVMSNSTISPSLPNRSSYGRSSFYERQGLGPSRVSEVPSWKSAPSIYTVSSSLTSPTRESSLYGTPSIFSSTTEPQRPKTATHRRMVAREPEVRGTSSRALLDFLDEGPSTGPTRGEHRTGRIPRAIAIQTDQYDPAFGSLITTPPTAVIKSPAPLTGKHSEQTHDFDFAISSVTEVNAEHQFPENWPVSAQTVEPSSHAPIRTLAEEHESPMEHAEIQEQTRIAPDDISGAPPHAIEEPTPEILAIQETILEYQAPTFHDRRYGHKILPPTPGPPPSQLLPLPPPPGKLPLMIKFPGTPSAIYGDVPPSPMPPGFTDIANWPTPPDAAPPRPPSPALSPETPIIPNFVPESTMAVLAKELPLRLRTAHLSADSKPEVLKLLPPPKRARSSSRSRPRPLRWVSIGKLMDPSAPSPEVDFGACLSQPLDLTRDPTPPRSMHA